MTTIHEWGVESLPTALKPYAELWLKPKTLLLLDGDLGAGKTFFVQSLLSIVGIQNVLSPTFSLINSQKLSSGLMLHHVDLYRLDSTEELDGIGFWDLFNESSSVVLVEWASRVPWRDYPKDWTQVQIQITTHADPHKRMYQIITE